MIASDACSFIAFMEGESADDVILIRDALERQKLFFAPAAASELVSAPRLPVHHVELILMVRHLPVQEGAGRVLAACGLYEVCDIETG